MLLEQVFQDVGLEIKAFEDQFDRTFEQAGALIARVASARVTTSIAAMHVQPVYHRLSEAYISMIEARQRGLALHGALRDLRDFLQNNPEMIFDCCGDPSVLTPKGAVVVPIHDAA